MAAEIQSLGQLTPDDRGSALSCTVDSLASVSVFVTLIRFWLSASRGIKFGYDDGSYLAAHLWAIASSVVWHLAAIAGLGKHIDALPPGSVDRCYKLTYAAQMLEMASMLCSKVAFALLTDRIRPGNVPARTAALVSSAAWAVVSICIVAFQRPLPYLWRFEPSRCATNGSLLYLIIASSAAIDVGLAVWIIPCVWRLRMNRQDRILVIFLLGLRTIILAPAILEMVLMHHFINCSDQTRVTINRAILNQVTVYVSLFTATIPRTNQFIFHLHTDRAGLSLPEFEILEPCQVVSRKQDPPLRLVPPNDTVLTTYVYSSADMRASSKESNFRSDIITVRKDILFTEQFRPGG